MPRKIKLVISGKGAETDAPAVEDVLDQLRDYHDILKEVERRRWPKTASAPLTGA
jgi:hypothetical protein